MYTPTKNTASVLTRAEWAGLCEANPNYLPACCEALEELRTAIYQLFMCDFNNLWVCKVYLYKLLYAKRRHWLDPSDPLEAIAKECRARIRE